MNRKLINSRIYLLVLPLIVLFVFNGKKYDAAVIDRINIPVRVCIQGEDCGAPLISASDMLVDSKGTKLYAGCIACHGTGGEGGIGPSFTGRSVDYISAALIQYKNKDVIELTAISFPKTGGASSFESHCKLREFFAVSQ